MNNPEHQPMKLDFSGWPLPDEYLIEVGRVSMLWTGVESLLNTLIGKLACFDDAENPIPLIMLIHASFPQKLDIFGSLCELQVQNHSHLNNYKQTIGLLKEAQRLRNDFAHHGLQYDENLGLAKMAKAKARGSLKFEIKDFSLADIRKAAIAIDEAQTSLYNLVLKCNLEPNWKRRQRTK